MYSLLLMLALLAAPPGGSQDVTIRGTIEGIRDPSVPTNYIVIDPSGAAPRALILVVGGSQFFHVMTIPVVPPNGPTPPPEPTPVPPIPAPTPTPAPPPAPTPAPSPSPVGGPMSVSLVWDASKETTDVAVVRTDLNLQTAILGLGCTYRGFEVGEAELAKRNLTGYVQAAGGAPCILAQDQTGKVVLAKPLPAKSADVLALIKSLRGGS